MGDARRRRNLRDVCVRAWSGRIHLLRGLCGGGGDLLCDMGHRDLCLCGGGRGGGRIDWTRLLAWSRK